MSEWVEIEKSKWILHCVLPLIIGSIFYLLFRKSITFIEATYLGDLKEFVSVDYSIKTVISIIPDWLTNSLPDGVWQYSFSSTIFLIWKGEKAISRMWLYLPVCIGLAFEFGQRFSITPGTFDLLDAGFIVVGDYLSKKAILN